MRNESKDGTDIHTDVHDGEMTQASRDSSWNKLKYHERDSSRHTGNVNYLRQVYDPLFTLFTKRE